MSIHECCLPCLKRHMKRATVLSSGNRITSSLCGDNCLSKDTQISRFFKLTISHERKNCTRLAPLPNPFGGIIFEGRPYGGRVSHFNWPKTCRWKLGIKTKRYSAIKTLELVHIFHSQGRSRINVGGSCCIVQPQIPFLHARTKCLCNAERSELQSAHGEERQSDLSLLGVGLADGEIPFPRCHLHHLRKSRRVELLHRRENLLG